MIETAKTNGVTPFDYLNHLMDKLPARKAGSDLSNLLPWNVSLNDIK